LPYNLPVLKINPKKPQSYSNKLPNGDYVALIKALAAKNLFIEWVLINAKHRNMVEVF